MSELDQLYSWVNDKDREPPGVAFVWDGPARRIAARIAELEQRDTKMRYACARAGMGVMETSGDWSLHDVSPLAKELDQKTLDTINENIELQAKLASLEQQAAVPIAEGELEVGAEYLGRLTYTNLHATAVWRPTDIPGDYPWSGASGCFEKSEFMPIRKLTPPPSK